MLTDLVNFNFQEKQERQEADRKRINILSIYFLKVFQAVVWKRVLTCLVNFYFRKNRNGKRHLIMLPLHLLKAFQAVVWERVLTSVVNFYFRKNRSEKRLRENVEFNFTSSYFDASHIHSIVNNL